MKPFPGYEEYYSVTEDGEVYSHGRTTMRKDGRRHVTKPKFLSKLKDGHGYYQVHLIGDKKKIMRIHRMVAICFLPNPEGLPCVNHKDGNIHNNHFSNLEWCTHSHNNKHAYDNGLKVASDNIRKSGDQSMSFRGYIYGKCLNTGEVVRFDGNKSLRAMGFSPQNAHKVINGERKHHKGWVFYR